MAISHPAEPTWRTISELTINIPEPIMEPTTSMVPSNNPSSLKIVLVLFLHNFGFGFEWLGCILFCEID
jgi:hypothetical protein